MLSRSLFRSTPITSRLINLDNHLAEMLLIPQILVRLTRLIEPKDPLINHRPDIVRLNRLNHIQHLLLAPDLDTPDNRRTRQSIQDLRGLLIPGPARAANIPDDTNHPLQLDALQTLADGIRAADLNHMIDAAARQLPRRLAPVRILAVVDHMVRAQFLESLCLRARRGRGDHRRTSRFSELLSRSALPQHTPPHPSSSREKQTQKGEVNTPAMQRQKPHQSPARAPSAPAGAA